MRCNCTYVSSSFALGFVELTENNIAETFYSPASAWLYAGLALELGECMFIANKSSIASIFGSARVCVIVIVLGIVFGCV